jgi:hypothetical protein
MTLNLTIKAVDFSPEIYSAKVFDIEKVILSVQKHQEFTFFLSLNFQNQKEGKILFW